MEAAEHWPSPPQDSASLMARGWTGGVPAIANFPQRVAMLPLNRAKLADVPVIAARGGGGVELPTDEKLRLAECKYTQFRARLRPLGPNPASRRNR